MRTKEIEQPIGGGPGKPPHIHRAIGRRPIMAACNSDGDIYMLEYAQGQQGATQRLVVHNDDAEREYAYDGGTEEALQLAAQEGWVVVSMKDDWFSRLSWTQHPSRKERISYTWIYRLMLKFSAPTVRAGIRAPSS